jgi:hypothetical protein
LPVDGWMREERRGEVIAGKNEDNNWAGQDL